MNGLRSAPGALVAALAVTTLACEDDQQFARPDFRRPTGLEFVQRTLDLQCPLTPIVPTDYYATLTATYSEEERAFLQFIDEAKVTENDIAGTRQATLFIADSEAEGIRLFNFEQSGSLVGDADGLPQELIVSQREDFPSGPTVYFPLVLSTPGFPTTVAASKDTVRFQRTCEYPSTYFLADGTPVDLPLTDGSTSAPFIVDLDVSGVRGARGFVLAPEGAAGGVDGAIYVIDALARPLSARADAYRGFLFDRLDLATFTETAGSWIPIDLDTVAYGGCDTPDPVITDPFAPVPCDTQGYDVFALLLDPVGAGDGRLVFFTLHRDGLQPPTLVTVDLPGPAHPTSMAVLDDRVVVSDASSSDVFEVPFTLTDGVPEFGAVRRINVFGPTRLVTDGGALGVFAVRIDKARMMHLVRGASNQLVLGSSPLESPFEYEADLGNPLRLGHLDLIDNPVLAVGLGQLDSLEQFGQGEVQEVVTEDDFLGEPRAPALILAYANASVNFVLGSPPRLAILAETQITSMRRLDEDLDDVRIKGCILEAEEDLQEENPEAPDVPACFAVLTDVTCESEGADAVFIERTVNNALYEVGYRGSLLTADSGVVTIGVDVDPDLVEVSDLVIDERQVEPGDTVLLNVDYFPNDPACQDLAATSSTLTGTVEEVLSEAIRFREPLAPDPGPCSAQVQYLDIFPSGPEVVLSQISGLFVGTVLQRVPATVTETRMGTATSSAGDVIEARFEGNSLTGDPLPVAFTFEGFVPEGLIREGSTFGLPEEDFLDEEGRICTANDECAEGFTCIIQPPPEVEVDESVARECFARCESNDPDLFSELRVRRVGLEVTVSGSPLAGIGLATNISGLGGTTRLSAPADAEFAPMRGSWIISTPGTSAIAEVLPISGAIDFRVIR